MIRTKRYIMTVNRGNLEEEFRLVVLRDTIKFLNRHIDHKLYIKCHGRFGKNNPNIHKSASYSECRLEDAVRKDIYIYER